MTTIPGITIVNDDNGQPEWVEFTQEAFTLMRPKQSLKDQMHDVTRWTLATPSDFADNAIYRRLVTNLTPAQREKIFGNSQGKEMVKLTQENLTSPEIAEAKVGANESGLYMAGWIAAVSINYSNPCDLKEPPFRLGFEHGLYSREQATLFAKQFNNPTKGGDEKCDTRMAATVATEPVSSNPDEETKAGEFDTSYFPFVCLSCAIHFKEAGAGYCPQCGLVLATKDLPVQNLSLRSRTVGQLTSHKGAESGAVLPKEEILQAVKEARYRVEADKRAEQDLRERFDEWFDSQSDETIKMSGYQFALEAVLHFQGFDKGGGE